VSRPKVPPPTLSSSRKQRCCSKAFATYDGPCAPVQPPVGGSLADIVLKAGDRILLQVISVEEWERV
jgi:hypothetical protein